MKMLSQEACGARPCQRKFSSVRPQENFFKEVKVMVLLQCTRSVPKTTLWILGALSCFLHFTIRFESKIVQGKVLRLAFCADS